MSTCVFRLKGSRPAFALDMSDEERAIDTGPVPGTRWRTTSSSCTPTLSRAPVVLDCLAAAAPYTVRPLDGIEATTLGRLPQGRQR